jgi:hypothetical protein
MLDFFQSGQNLNCMHIYFLKSIYLDNNNKKLIYIINNYNVSYNYLS